jgi:hypothetical protein
MAALIKSAGTTERRPLTGAAVFDVIVFTGGGVIAGVSVCETIVFTGDDLIVGVELVMQPLRDSAAPQAAVSATPRIPIPMSNTPESL